MSLHTSVLVRRADHGYFRFLRHHSFIVNPEVLQTMNKRAKNKLEIIVRLLRPPTISSTPPLGWPRRLQTRKSLRIHRRFLSSFLQSFSFLTWSRDGGMFAQNWRNLLSCDLSRASHMVVRPCAFWFGGRWRSLLAMAGVLIPVPFPQAKKSNYNFVPQKKVVDYYAAAVKTLEVRPIFSHKIL